MVCTDSVVHLTAQELQERAREESARYQRGEPHDGSSSFELFRRAVVSGDEACWQALLAVYHDRVLRWCLRAGADPRVGEDCVAATWSRFWQNFTPAKLAQAGGSRAVLGYLKLCARSAVLDDARRRAKLASLEELHYDAEDAAVVLPAVDVERLDAPRFWRLVEQHLQDERDRVLVYLTYELNLRPAEIQRRRPDLFPQVQDVYRLTRNLLDRLRRSPALAAWWAAESA